MRTLLMRNWLSLLMSFFTTLSPVQITKEAIPQTHPGALVAQAKRPIALAVKLKATRPAEKTSSPLNSFHGYAYTFAGQATLDGEPCPNARVEVRVTSGYGFDIQNVQTGPDGRYRVTLRVQGEPTDTLSWEIHALTPDFKKAELEGQQILMDEHAVQLNNPLIFVES